jgi:hypothetical protein
MNEDYQETLHEPLVKKARYECSDSPGYSHSPSDKTTSDGTDSSNAGIHFTAQSWSSSDEPSLNSYSCSDDGYSQPESIVSGGFEPSCGNWSDVDVHSDVGGGDSYVDDDSLRNYESEIDEESTLKYDVEDDDEDDVQSTSSVGFPTDTVETGNIYDSERSHDNFANIDENSHEYSYISPQQSVSSIEPNAEEDFSSTSLDENINSQNSKNKQTNTNVEIQPIEREELSGVGNRLSNVEDGPKSFVSNSEGSSISFNIADHTGPSTSFQANLRKIASVNRDAENISAMLGITDVDTIYHKLKQLRNNANRTDLVTNEILENGIDSLQQDTHDHADTADEDCDILDLVEKVQLSVENKIPNVNLDEILILLRNHSGKKTEDKVRIIVDILLEQYCADGKDTEVGHIEETVTTSATENTSQETDIFRDVKLVQNEMKEANPNEIFMLLEQFADLENRVKMVINTLIVKDHSKSKSNTPTCTETANMPMLDDLNIISALFPNRERTEIYAYLEAHYHDPKRIQVVTEELLQQQIDNTERTGTIIIPPPNINDLGFIEKLQQEVEVLRNIFPDCDPDYLFSELEARAGDPHRTESLSAKLFDQRNYPRLGERLKKEQVQEQVRKLRELKLNVEEFLTMFSDPKETFYDVTKPVTERYKQHAWQQLLKDFPMLTDNYIKKKFDSQNQHYLPTMTILNKVAALYRNGLYIVLLYLPFREIIIMCKIHGPICYFMINSRIYVHPFKCNQIFCRIKDHTCNFNEKYPTDTVLYHLS